MLKNNLIHILFCLFFLFSLQSQAEDNPNTSTTSQSELEAPNNKIPTPPQLSWSIDLQQLSKSNNADKTIWLDIKEQKTLVLKYLTRNKIKRGDIILLPAQGENAEHPRLVNALTQQLIQLGWNIYIPSLPIEDYPDLKANEMSTDANNTAENQNNLSANTQSKELASEEKSITNKITTNLTQAYFSNAKDYQSLIDLILKNLISTINPQSKQLMLIANQHSAYWILNTTKQNIALTQVVLIEPLLPKNINPPLDSSFEGQYLPVYSFIKNHLESKVFIDAIENNFWKTTQQRIDVQLIDNFYLAKEDIRLAKRITGWSESIKIQP